MQPTCFAKKYAVSMWIFCILAMGMGPIVHAQDITLLGMVSDRQTGQALEMANVTLQKSGSSDLRGETTDRNGLYEFGGLDYGTYILRVSYVGYETHTDTLQLERRGSRVTRNIRLSPAVEGLEEVTISERRSRNTVVGQTTIDAEEIGRVPTPAGSGDLVGVLQNQPGVVAAGDRGGSLFIRGGTPSENLVLVDGLQIYQPFHILGFFSAFPADVISKADLYAGGFGPRYNGRTSSVMDVQLKNGHLYERNWSASVSPFISELFLESPIAEGKSSLLVSGRGSLIQGASSIYLDEQPPLRFNSQLVKLSGIGEKGPCSAHLMRTYDRGKVNFDVADYIKWNNFVVGGRCAGVSESSAVSYADVNLGVSHFSNEAGGVDSPRRRSSITKFQVDVNLTQKAGTFRLNYGFFGGFNFFSYNISDLFIGVESRKETLFNMGGYFSIDIPLHRTISIDPGVSVTSYITRFRPSIEPRLRLSWQPRNREDEELHAALGVYHQPLLGIGDFRDAGNAFTAWMPMPDPNRRMEARHALLGWKQSIGRHLDYVIEGYYKTIKNKPVSTWNQIAKFSTNLADAGGEVYGADVRLNFNHRIFYATVGYGYSFTQYETAQDHFGLWFGEPVQQYHPPHDRRHQLNTGVGFRYGNFTADVSFNYGSGLPFTRPLGFDSFFRFEGHLPDVTGEYGEPRLLIDKPFDGRLPDYHRIDLSVEQAFHWSPATVRVKTGVINMLDRNNLFYYDIFNQQGVRQLSFMPFLSLKFES